MIKGEDVQGKDIGGWVGVLDETSLNKKKREKLILKKWSFCALTLWYQILNNVMFLEILFVIYYFVS